MAFYSPTEPGYYWIVSPKRLNEDPVIALLFDDTDSIYTTPGIHLVWGLILWECNCDYEDYVSLHPSPIQIIKP